MSVRSALTDRISSARAVAVVRADDASAMTDIVRALHAGGVTCVEITMTVPNALDAIRAVAARIGNELPADIILGVGSVTSAKMTDAALDAGATFVVSPVFKSEIIRAAHDRDAPAMPGALTPTEIQAAYEAGADVVKVFPANVFGIGYFKSVRAPLPHLKLMPTGGVTLTNAQDWLDAGAVAVGLGSALVDKAAVREGRFEVLTQNARTLIAGLRRTHETPNTKH
ncbi:MAG: bifunctional 4-hydroxy-2-oxoglutarate aldolase/2-dehydro-3-deoxy-phosphogluconate aldolase [Bacteroidota bacterium]